MNIVKELRKSKGIQQKELALSIGVAQPTVSEWESGKKDPSGDRLHKLAEFFGVEEMVILGIASNKKFLQEQPKSPQIRIVSSMMANLPQDTQDQIVAIVQAVVTHAHKEV